MEVCEALWWVTSSRLFARTISKQIMKEAEEATAPHQHAFGTKVGCGCVAHILQSSTDEDEHDTVVSVDGIGAYDTISRRAMLQGVMWVPSGDRVLPFLKQFYSSPSVYVWEDVMGTQHEVTQGEGGEQGDPCLGQHRTLTAVEGRLKVGEKFFAFFDGIYLICQLDRVQDAHHGKTDLEQVRLHPPKEWTW